MTPITSYENQETILIDNISERHIVVAIIDNAPCILSREFDGEIYSFKTLKTKQIIGNYMTKVGRYTTIAKTVKEWLKTGVKIQVFNSDDWKKALQWLIDNCE